MTLATIFMTSTLMANGTLQNGTPISVRLQNVVSSSGGSEPEFVIAFDVKDPNGQTLIKEGTPVAVSNDIKKRKSIGKPGKIDVKFESTTTVDGQIVLLNGSKSFSAESKKGKVLGISLGVGIFLFWPMIAYLAKKGDDVTVQPSIITNAAFTVGTVNVK